MHVARAGRQVDQQEVELTPAGLVDHLPQRIGRHRSPPKQRVGGFDEETDRHDADAPRLGGQQVVRPLLLLGLGDVSFQAEHLGLRRAVNVRIEDADAIAQVIECDGQVGRDGRFAYASLARGHSQDAADSPG